jgi:hypothetical protein
VGGKGEGEWYVCRKGAERGGIMEMCAYLKCLFNISKIGL